VLGLNEDLWVSVTYSFHSFFHYHRIKGHHMTFRECTQLVPEECVLVRVSLSNKYNTAWVLSQKHCHASALQYGVLQQETLICGVRFPQGSSSP